jgi:hypothetical protein
MTRRNNAIRVTFNDLEYQPVVDYANLQQISLAEAVRKILDKALSEAK